MKNIPIGEVLKEKGYITEEQLQTALTYQKEHRDSGKRLGAVLIDMGFITDRQLLTAMGDKLNMRILSLETFPIDAQAVQKIPRPLAMKYHAMAVAVDGRRLSIVINDPLEFYGIEDIRQVTGMTLDISLAEKAAIDHAIDVYYSEIEARRVAATMGDTAGTLLENMGQQAVHELDDGAADTPIIRLLNSLLLHGYNIGASDIHIEPMAAETRVRIRVDGMLIHYMNLDKRLHPSVVARTKILSNLDIAEKRIPQDGHFKILVESVEMNLRVSVVPSVYGEKIVLRYLNSSTDIPNSRRFGMNEKNYQRFLRMLQNPNGIIYITGPTGSGKTTTLYFALEELVKRPVNISTIEDPVERHIHGVTQLQVNPLAGLTFESGLRSLLRQDPDIIMVGETRDAETAAISVRSAITGHLVLSTLHTNDAISSIIRLKDMGVESYLVANSLVGLVAQRLVRRICPYCKTAYTPTAEELALLGEGHAPAKLYKGTGCPACSQTGYKGRIAVHEVVTVDKTMRHMIAIGSPMDEMLTYVRQHQDFTTLVEEVRTLVEEGVTTAEELLKLTYYTD